MGGVNSHHCHHAQAITVPLVQDGAQGLGQDCHDPNRSWQHRQQGQPCRCHHHQDMATNLHSTDAVILPHIKDR